MQGSQVNWHKQVWEQPTDLLNITQPVRSEVLKYIKNSLQVESSQYAMALFNKSKKKVLAKTGLLNGGQLRELLS